MTDPAILPPWDHQTEARNRMRGLKAFFLSMEQRTGKTRPILEEVSELYIDTDEIDALLIIAMPSGAPRNWLNDEIPLWLNPTIDYHSMLWKANRAHLKGYQAALNCLLLHKGLSILAVNGEAIITENFKDFAGKFLRKRKCYVVGDETTLIMKTPGAKRTKTMAAIAKLSKIRRCLDGTPSGEGPLDLYTQYNFLDRSILNFGSYFAFRNRYAQLEEGYNHNTETKYVQVKKDPNTNEPIYQNLDELQAKIAPHTFRVLYREAFPEAAQPIFQKRYFPLHEAQRKAYDSLRDEYEAELSGLGTVTVAHVLTRYIRLQQISSGYWPAQKAAIICPECMGEGCEHCNDLGAREQDIPLTRIVPADENPRLLALKQELEMAHTTPAIIWARFDQDIEDILKYTTEWGYKPVRYDGKVDEVQKSINKDAFQGGDADLFVAKTRSAGRAIKLSAARSMIYYTSEFGLLQRLQSQVRPETPDRRIPTGIVDLVAEETVDELIVSAHRQAKRIADVIFNEEGRPWI